jgi:hypothetical protein
MLDEQEMNDVPGADDHGNNGKPSRLSGEARLQSAASILAMGVLRRKTRMAVNSAVMVGGKESAPVPGEGLDSLPEQSIHS